jgi:DnaJ domain
LYLLLKHGSIESWYLPALLRACIVPRIPETSSGVAYLCGLDSDGHQCTRHLQLFLGCPHRPCWSIRCQGDLDSESAVTYLTQRDITPGLKRSTVGQHSVVKLHRLACRVKEKAEQTEIINAYRKLAREWHPDRNKHRRPQAEKAFSDIAHAYETLRNADSRKDYDYALRHPEEFAYNRAKYYYRQFYTRHLRMNPFVVVFVGVALWSAFEWFSRNMSYKQAVETIKQEQPYKLNLKRLKKEKLEEMERAGLVKRKLSGRRCAPTRAYGTLKATHSYVGVPLRHLSRRVLQTAAVLRPSGSRSQPASSQPKPRT